MVLMNNTVDVMLRDSEAKITDTEILFRRFCGGRFVVNFV
jgi:hypothetical protein